MTLVAILEICELFKKLPPNSQNLVAHLMRGTQPTRSYGEVEVTNATLFLDTLYNNLDMQEEVEALYVLLDLV